MNSEMNIVAGDCHFHLYPGHDPERSVSGLINNLELMAGSAGVIGQKDNIFKIAFLAESRQFNYFRKILNRELNFERIGLETSAGPEEHCVSFRKQGELKLCLVAGRQIVTKEKLEILGLGMGKIVPDGLPAGEVIEKIIAAGGLPALAFSPGKWLFKRAKIARRLMTIKFGRPLLIGDSALRPLGWGRPAIMRRAARENIAVLPGSDPLPPAGEEKYAGCYGFVYRGEFDSARPLTAMKQIIANVPSAIMPAGRRCSFMNFAGRLFRLSKSKKN